MARPVDTLDQDLGRSRLLTSQNLWRSRAGLTLHREISRSRVEPVLVELCTCLRVTLVVKECAHTLSRSQFPGETRNRTNGLYKLNLVYCTYLHYILHSTHTYIRIYACAYKLGIRNLLEENKAKFHWLSWGKGKLTSYSYKWMQRYCTTKLKNKSMNSMLGWMPQLEVEIVLQSPPNFHTSEWASMVPLTTRMLWTTLFPL